MKKEYYFKKPTFHVSDINIQQVRRDRGYKFSFPNRRASYAFIYLSRGSMLYSFTGSGDDSITVNASELLFVPKGIRYTATYLEDGTEIKIIQFDISFGDFSEFLSSHEKIKLPNAKNIIERFFESERNVFSSRIFHYVSLLYDLFWQIELVHSAIPKKYSKLQPALDSIQLCPEENKKISYYSEMCNMSETNFRKLFGEYTGKSPIEYRNDIRLERARAKLQSGEYTVSEVSEACGFTNLSFFTRLYKEKYGYTPKKEY